MAGLGGHISQQDKELIEAGVHPVINEDYTIKKEKKQRRVRCKFCNRLCNKNTAHLHQGLWVGNECCWDDRLKSSE